MKNGMNDGNQSEEVLMANGILSPLSDAQMIGRVREGILVDSSSSRAK